MRAIRNKLLSRRGINRLVAILVALGIVLVIVAGIPIYRAYKARADIYSCTVATKKAQDMLDVEFLWNYELSHEEAEAVIERAKMEMDALCPAGGDYFLVDREDSDQRYRVTCGIHEADTRLRTRLNAYHVYELLGEEIIYARRRGEALDDPVVLTVNGRKLEVTELEEPNDLRYGTGSNIDYDGIVCFFTRDDAGELNWFVYADENHAGRWNPVDGWTGDAYNG